jgi:hypothetical protein
MSSYQNPYIEQQLPFFQLPQTVPPFELPHVPSVVTGAAVPVGAEVDAGRITGSCVVDAPFVQPDWHPLSTRQKAGVEPHHLRRK